MASFVIGAGSFIRNVGAGSYGAAALDLGGMVVDGLAVATPFVPGGAGAGIRAVRLAGKADDLVDASRGGAAAVDAVEAAAGSIRNVNPLGGMNNCAKCAVATDALLAGRPASALAGGPVTLGRLEGMFKGTFQSMGSQGAIEAAVKSAGNGARGIVYIGAPGAKVGHVFNVVNQNGVIRFLDGQTGKAAVFKQTWTDIRFLRTN